MRVLAFDPGFERLGVAVVEKKDGKEVVVHSECVQTLASLPFSERLLALGKATEQLIQKFKPDAMALEEIFFGKKRQNRRTNSRGARHAHLSWHAKRPCGIWIYTA